MHAVFEAREGSSRIGDFLFLPGDRVIGEGRFGTVYAGVRATGIGRGVAEAAEPRASVAIKLVRSGGRFEGVGMQAVREIKLLQEIRIRPHPNVVQVRAQRRAMHAPPCALVQSLDFELR